MILFVKCGSRLKLITTKLYIFSLIEELNIRYSLFNIHYSHSSRYCFSSLTNKTPLGTLSKIHSIFWYLKAFGDS
jgi:hypothetical protein